MVYSSYINLPSNAVAGQTATLVNTWAKNETTEFYFDGVWKPVAGQTVLEIDYKLSEPIATMTATKTWGEIIQAETGALPPDWMMLPSIKLNVGWNSSIDFGSGDQFSSTYVTCGGPCAFAGIGGSPNGTVKLWSLRIYS